MRLPLSSVVDPDPHGSAFIWLSWIRIGNADLDPGSWFSAIPNGFCTFVGMFFLPITLLKVYFSRKNSTFLI
jgi:hypothetical protein